MLIQVENSMTLEQVQNKFNLRYPFLKLEFFSHPHSIHGGSRKEHMIAKETLIKDCRTKHTQGNLEIHPYNSVAHLEKSFEEIFGLYAQVFRKSGELWIETTVTDDWTLEKQNTEAELFYEDITERGGYDRDAILQ
ncbi:MAG: hypothetical protein IPM92_08660 [Saprospiraceae bacterium]|nr:hypothetical protein [Saprospiraceae bacterium]